MHTVAGGLQRGSKTAHGGKQRQHLLRVVAHVAGLAADFHHHVHHIVTAFAVPAVASVELVPQNQAQLHAVSQTNGPPAWRAVA
ncbi:hypothetical protein D3C78_1603820 [compost metagenome]